MSNINTNKIQIQCAICSNISEHIVLLSTKEKGPKDLDSRPSEFLRSTMDYWIQYCPVCKYSTQQIGKPFENNQEDQTIVIDFLKSNLYNEIAIKYQYCKILMKFILNALLLEKLSKGPDHLWKIFFSWLHCAWIADDLKDNDLSIQFRSYALNHILHDNHNLDYYDMLQLFPAEKVVNYICIVDTIRRAKKFETCNELCQKIFQNESTLKEDFKINDDEDKKKKFNFLLKVLHFEFAKSQKQDSQCYTATDVLNYSIK